MSPRRGLFLGKFLPPHRGHLHVVERALAEVDDLTILVCSLEEEPIPGALRAEWMRELCPRARVVAVAEEVPQYPEEHPDFWEIWTDLVRRHVDGPIDVVFTSEKYGDELARRLGAMHRCVDRGRETFPVSGTAVRQDPFGHWDLLPEPVRARYALRVVLTGSECTGKTTLARALSERLHTVWVPEYGREYVDEVGRAPAASDIEPIARGQAASEERLARRANKVLVMDTDLVSTAVYGRHYFGEIPAWIDGEIRRPRPRLHLLCDVDVPWMADGAQRDRGDRRDEMQELFREALRGYRLGWTDLRGPLEERVATALEVVSAAIARSSS